MMIQFFKDLFSGLVDDTWFETGETRTVVVDTVTTPDGRTYQRTQKKKEFVNFDTGTVELREAGDVSGPELVTEE